MSEAAPIRIFFVDDHQMFIDGLKSLLREETRFQFAGEANSGEEALQRLSEIPVDVLITDVSMPGMRGTELARRVKTGYPDIKVLVVTMYNDMATIKEILMAEAEGYILKNTGKAELLKALDQLTDNGTFYSHEIMEIMMKSRMKRKLTTEQVLTARETEIVRLIAEEMNTAAIADRLFISARTVETHRRNILDKIGCKTTVGLMKYAFENRLL